MGIIFKKPKTPKPPELPPVAPPPPKVTDATAATNISDQVTRMRRRATALADPAALAVKPNTAKKTALGT